MRESQGKKSEFNHCSTQTQKFSLSKIFEIKHKEKSKNIKNTHVFFITLRFFQNQIQTKSSLIHTIFPNHYRFRRNKLEPVLLQPKSHRSEPHKHHQGRKQRRGRRTKVSRRFSVSKSYHLRSETEVTVEAICRSVCVLCVT